MDVQVIISDVRTYMLEPDGDWHPVARPYYGTPPTVRTTSVSWEQPPEMLDTTRSMLPLVGRCLRRMLPNTPVHLVPRVLDFNESVEPGSAATLGGVTL